MLQWPTGAVCAAMNLELLLKCLPEFRHLAGEVDKGLAAAREADGAAAIAAPAMGARVQAGKQRDMQCRHTSY